MCAEVVVLVDYQEVFPAAHDEDTIDAVLRELAAARLRGAPVVLVTFKGGGPIFPEVLAALDGYDNVVTVEKTQKDGSLQVMEACKAQGSSPKQFRLFGVSTSACVFSTAAGLGTVFGAQVAVVQSACNNSDYADVDPWSAFRDQPGLTLVP